MQVRIYWYELMKVLFWAFWWWEWSDYIYMYMWNPANDNSNVCISDLVYLYIFPCWQHVHYAQNSLMDYVGLNIFKWWFNSRMWYWMDTLKNGSTQLTPNKRSGKGPKQRYCSSFWNVIWTHSDLEVGWN